MALAMLTMALRTMEGGAEHHGSLYLRWLHLLWQVVLAMDRELAAELKRRGS